MCAHTQTSLTTNSYLHGLASSCVHTGTWCPSTFGSIVKRANSCQRRGSLSWHGVGFGQPNSTPHQERAQSVLNCFKTLSGRTAVPLKTLSFPDEGSAFSEMGHPLAPVYGPVETPRMVPGWDAEVLGEPTPGGITHYRFSTRTVHKTGPMLRRGNLFVEWCTSHQEYTWRC